MENYNKEVVSNFGNMHQSIFVVPRSKTKVAFNNFFDFKRCLPNPYYNIGGWQTNHFPIKISNLRFDTFTTYSCIHNLIITCHIFYLNCMKYSNQHNKEVKNWIVMYCQKFWGNGMRSSNVNKTGIQKNINGDGC